MAITYAYYKGLVVFDILTDMEQQVADITAMADVLLTELKDWDQGHL